MLFIESKTLNYRVDGPGRLRLLADLQQKGRIPIIRTARLNCFDWMLSGSDRTSEFESAIAAWADDNEPDPYLRGDLFCAIDYVSFLICDETKDAISRIRAGIVYDAKTAEPFRKLDAFCHDIRESLLQQAKTSGHHAFEGDAVPQWQHGKPLVPEGFRRFVAKQDTDSLYTSLRKETMSKRILAASKLENESARVFLRSAREAHQEGYAAKLLTGDTAAGAYEFSIERLEDVGLIEREVQVSCRKTGHALFRLPNSHALVVVTVSDATCSECGSPVADEIVEEVIAPTQLATSLLEDGSWLVSRLHFLLREMGVPESEIAVGPSEGDGHGQMMANICGESFLLVARDGDLTPAFARWAVDLEIETEASHLVIVATGRVHNQARLLLLNHSRRRTRAGRDFELVLADGPGAASNELGDAFERVSQRVVAEQVCDLDSGLGLSVANAIITKFKFLRPQAEPPVETPEEPETEGFSVPAPPLALAAHAAANSADVIDVTPEPETAEGESFETAPLETSEFLESDYHAPFERL